MATLREKFITEDHRPKGLFFIPDLGSSGQTQRDTELSHAVMKARRLLIRPEISSVIIERNYADLTGIANRVFSHYKNHSPLFKADKAREFSVFRNEAARDFRSVARGFSKDQDFPEYEITLTSNQDTQSHIDVLQQPNAHANIDKSCLGGGIVIMQALSVAGTGIYCERDLADAHIMPEYGTADWHYNIRSAELEGLLPFYTKPGDIAVFRQGDWDEYHSPSVHTWPRCSKEEKRLAYCAMGYAKPVFG